MMLFPGFQDPEQQKRFLKLPESEFSQSKKVAQLKAPLMEKPLCRG